MNGVRAFREAFLSSDILDETSYIDFDSRKLRYQIYWALYESTVYRNIHKWSQSYRTTFGLYRYVRNIYSPAYRIGEFWKAHLFGGGLDPRAGDGVQVPSALPIVTENELLRPAIAQLWRVSNWQVNKDILSLWGSMLGDVIVKVVDDPVRKKVYLKVIHPGTVKELSLDDFGNVKGYVIEEEQVDPNNASRTAIYQEVATRDGDNVIYSTTLNNAPYAAEEGGLSDWERPYGFVPMVIIQHNNVGMPWGWSEIHPDQSKFREADDLASKLSDQIRKMVDAPWLFSGVDDPRKRGKGATTTASTPTSGNPEAGREEIPVLYGPVGATATPLVAQLDIASTSAYITTILQEIERDYPELAADIHNVKGELSGKALRINRQPAETKVLQRRANYDDAIVRAHQMAIAIGGFGRYPGYEGFNLDSYASGKLAHSIGPRSVFGKDKTDDLEYDQLFWAIAKTAKEATGTIIPYLRRAGWSEEDIATVQNDPEYQARIANANMATLLNGSLNQVNNG